MDLAPTAVVSTVQSRPRTGESICPAEERRTGCGGHDPKGIILSGSHTSSPCPPPPLLFPVAASKSLARAPFRKKNSKGPVIKITEMSEKLLLQESEACE